MIEYEYFDLFEKDNIDKQAVIEDSDGGRINNEDLFQNSEELTENLCSENELRFGSCEASQFKFKVANIVKPLKDEWITYRQIIDHHDDNPFSVGRYKIKTDELTADRKWRDIVAYDAMYDILCADMTQWYNTILPRADSTVTLLQFRTSFISYFGLEEVVPEGGLVNDNMIVTKTIEIIASTETDTDTAQKSVIGEAISGKTIITAICEINGCFGHIGRDGKFHYIYLTQNIEGLYPSEDRFPSEDLFPKEPYSVCVGQNGSYIDCKYQDIVTHSITKLQIRQEENDIGKIYPEGPVEDTDNCYIIEGNFLVYGKSSDELLVIARNIFSKISKVTYRPLVNADVKGNPCFEVGDAIRISTKDELVETYILERTLKGIQALRDTYSSNGVEWYTEKVNGVHQSIKQLQGKANKLTRTIEETRLEMSDIGAGLSNDIKITAEGLQADIAAEQQRAKGEESSLSNRITATSEGLSAEITEKTQTWDTGKYDISYRDEGEPDIEPVSGKYYLDEQSGAIYEGHQVKWNVAALYEWNEDRYAYVLKRINPGYEDYSFPIKMGTENIGKYGYVSVYAPAEGDDIDEDWIEVDIMPPYNGDMATWWIQEGYNGWTLVDYATLTTLPEMQTKISITASKVEMKVSKGDVTSQLLIEPTDIYLKTGRLRIETNNLEINKDGVSGEILSRDFSSGATKETARYIKLNTGGIEGGYGGDMKCKIVCNDKGLEFRGKILTFCMDSIKVGKGMNAGEQGETRLVNTADGDFAYVAPIDGKTDQLKAAVLHVWNGLILDNTDYGK